jgi:hypothetical protein
MTWTMTHCHIPLSPEDIEEMEVSVDLLKQLQEKPERFLMLFQPRFTHFSWFSDVLFEKICKLVKKEAIKEVASLEAQLQAQRENC